MARLTPQETEIGRIRHVLAGLAVETELVRLSCRLACQDRLARKYGPGQPRAPAGQPDGGRWVDEDGASLEPATVGPGRWTSLPSQEDAGPRGAAASARSSRTGPRS